MSKLVKLQWHTEQRKVSDLIVWDKNPHTMNEREKSNLSKSLDKFDYVEVVIINTDNRLIGGHQRRNDFIAKSHILIKTLLIYLKYLTKMLLEGIYMRVCLILPTYGLHTEIKPMIMYIQLKSQSHCTKSH